MDNNIPPLFRAVISTNDNDKIEVSHISLVDAPAIQKNFLAFSKKEKKQTFSVNQDERIITGLAMVADLPIYRCDPDGTEYYVFFDAKTIKDIAQRFFRKGYNHNFNLNHSAKDKTTGVYIFESWITDKGKGKNPMDQFSDIADGSWFVSAKVENDALWQEIKDGKFNGFSVEGFFNMELLEFSKQPNEQDEFCLALFDLLQQAVK